MSSVNKQLEYYKKCEREAIRRKTYVKINRLIKSIEKWQAQGNQKMSDACYCKIKKLKNNLKLKERGYGFVFR